MKVGIFLVLFGRRPLAEALDFVKSAGCESVEIGTGGYVGNAHCKPHELLQDRAELGKFRDAIRARDLEISALSCHGNPLHPDPQVAQAHDTDFRNSVRLAAELGVGRVVTFAGCPGDSPTATRPNWVVTAWPTDFLHILEWQWNERVIPYWQEAAAFAREHGVKVAIELHPGFVVYNSDSFLCLREAVGETIGVNFDPSHLFWQQMDPLVCVRQLGDAILHVHAKDTWLDAQNIARNGVLDTKLYTDLCHRAWYFRTVGYAHGPDFWRALVSSLRLAGYDGALSIEHEDALMSVDEGFTKAVAFLKETVIQEPAPTAWWA
ncbi:MAG TPA: sugar phosphate isomerase/epimerase [Herpetosiphonaceae bacterium]|nr:sugar phosphate isomerase/epimerase [Herpetosiphonaceae bacterium]